VNVVGFAIDDYPRVVAGIEESLGEGLARAVDGFELNVSCPNTKAGGEEFGADPVALREVVERARRETKRPLFVKLAPTLPNIGQAARISADAGADAITVVNTIPGLVIDVEQRRVAPDGSQHGQSGLHVDADVAAVDGQRERFGGWQAVPELAVDQQRPHVAEGHVTADQIFDVHAAVPQRAAVLVGFGDLGGEGDDTFESLNEAFRYR